MMAMNNCFINDESTPNAYNILQYDYSKRCKRQRNRRKKAGKILKEVIEKLTNEVIEKVGKLTNELTVVKKELTDVKNELTDVKNELTDVKNELTVVKKELTDVVHTLSAREMNEFTS